MGGSAILTRERLSQSPTGSIFAYPENSVGNSRASNAPYVPASNLRLEFPLSEWRFAAKRHANDTSGPAQKRKRPRQKGISAPLTIVDITACRTRFRSSRGNLLHFF